MEVTTNDPVHFGAREYIIANTQYHSKLLSTISELEYVPHAKEHQTEFLADLEQQIDKGRKRIEDLAKKTNKERKEHESLRDSTTRRFAHIVVGKKGKFSEMASKEEKEYVEALEREMTERDNQTSRVKMYKEGKQALDDLNNKLVEYESAQAELQTLYNRTFEGPTPDFPEEDPLEYEFGEANEAHRKAQASVNSESRAGELLTKAVKVMEICAANMSDALAYSRYDMWGGGSMSDMMERSALRNASVNAAQAKNLADQAARTSSQVQSIPALQIADGSLLSDVFFDNIFTDMAFHDKIKQSCVQVSYNFEKLKRERDAAWRRLDNGGNVLMGASARLDYCRRELDSYRRALFESVAAQNPPPPSYSTLNTPEGSTNEVAQISPNTSSGVEKDVDAPTNMSTEKPIMPESQPSGWRSRNPFAYALSEERGAGTSSIEDI
ncbi:hypothetical protein CPB83DRAFT_853334 [Crepidotus variabilis]|uniref:Uncharacterized protein n=1 Tax=Crepidotus variabilis TaxID=179855 RepID=A0A9P6JQW4_9AGAR|nr:hypothetical protein CPB83DRAFT_853334 [Crepidotus variabilis]